ncbi:FaeA/PapI family transcriptional regulator [Pantoea sp. 1.19]|uniref:FaeA/PapI family transcriptional regulator n=1 Tax=Pantoea sp. 1.19 TaxID=1925589 RepID=UPI0009488E22|nr:FaeA/PapI family transcriptional regulator [Pantoea sp. 1.19]
MKSSPCAYLPGPDSDAPVHPFDNLMTLAQEMGIGKDDIASINTPEKMRILHLLQAHSPSGLSTREIANYCGISIYKVRHLLLPLEKCDCVIRNKRHKHHHWYIPASLHCSG